MKSCGWTLKHNLFANMGGFMLSLEDGRDVFYTGIYLALSTLDAAEIREITTLQKVT